MLNDLYTIDEIRAEIIKRGQKVPNLFSFYGIINRTLKMKPIKKGGYKNKVKYYNESQKLAIIHYNYLYNKRRQLNINLGDVKAEIKQQISYCKQLGANNEKDS